MFSKDTTLSDSDQQEMVACLDRLNVVVLLTCIWVYFLTMGYFFFTVLNIIGIVLFKWGYIYKAKKTLQGLQRQLMHICCHSMYEVCMAIWLFKECIHSCCFFFTALLVFLTFSVQSFCDGHLGNQIGQGKVNVATIHGERLWIILLNKSKRLKTNI